MQTIEKAATMTDNTGTIDRAAVRAKDHASMAVVLAAASIAWFVWGHQGGEISGWLEAGMGAGLLALIAAIVVMRGIRVAPSLAFDPAIRKVYWTSVIAEVVLIVGGVIVLNLIGQSAYLSTWTLAIVGLHFLPFVKAFRAPLLRWAAVACVLVAGIALWAGLAGWAPAPTIGGAGGGLVLLGFSLLLMREARGQRPAMPVS